jgi:aminobenzoyl-glutamate utilization protein B
MPDEPGQSVASTDVGDISWYVPVGGFVAATQAYGSPGHSWQIVACTGSGIDEKGMIVAP